MKTLIGGAIAAVLGAIFLAIWWGAFLQLLAGSIPVMGGCLALYLGFDELKDTWQRENGVAPADMGVESDMDKFKQENEELKKEIDALKAKK